MASVAVAVSTRAEPVISEIRESMKTPVKKFCLMTMGRSGSTSLMNAIAPRLIWMVKTWESVEQHLLGTTCWEPGIQLGRI